MTRIVFVTQVIDEDDPVLGFTTSLVGALASRAEVVVISLTARSVPDLGVEVIPLDRGGRRSRLRRAVRYEASLLRLLGGGPPAVLFAHMCPPYITAAAPITKATGTPSILWYAHSADTPMLRRAERLADAVATSLPGANPRSGPKILAIGQAIDTGRFSWCAPQPPAAPLRLVALGRFSPVKNYPVLIRGLALARQRGTDATLRIVGPVTTTAERDHRRELDRLVADLGLGDVVTLTDGASPAAIPELLAGADALVNGTNSGGDKVVFEAMACGRPVLVSNPAFSSLVADVPIPLLFDQGDPVALAGAIAELERADLSARVETATRLRARVVAGHSLDHWADEVVALAAALRASRRPRPSRPPSWRGSRLEESSRRGVQTPPHR